MQALANVTQITFSPSLPDDRTVNYFQSQPAMVGEVLLQAILLEVCSFPKPGLVTPVSTGSHSDMNLQTFLLSSSAIAPASRSAPRPGSRIASRCHGYSKNPTDWH